MLDNIDAILKEEIKENRIVSIFSDYNNMEKCTVGFIGNFDDDFVLIKCVNTNGEEDGLAIRRVDNIFRIDIGGEYESKLQKLYRLKGEKHNIYLDKNSDNVFNQILGYSISNNKVLEISIDENNEQELICGTVESINDNGLIKIKKINFYGYDDGVTFIDVDDIVTLNCDSNDAKDLFLLNKSVIK